MRSSASRASMRSKPATSPPSGGAIPKAGTTLSVRRFGTARNRNGTDGRSSFFPSEKFAVSLRCGRVRVGRRMRVEEIEATGYTVVFFKR